MPSKNSELDAIVIAGPTSAVRVCGLTLDERARRVALKAGARRVLVANMRSSSAEQLAWAAEQPGRDLLVLDATEHVVHVPLIQAIQGGGTQIAIDERHAFAGALIADGDRVAAAASATTSAALAALAARWAAEGVPTSTHGELARHPARTPSERRAAIHFLFGLVRKAQDSWLVRTINRKISYPFTRLLLPLSWLSPNMISICVFLIGAVGCVILTTPTYAAAVQGASLLLFAGYLDGCDGEVARIRLESSKLGAWIDTIADEITTVLSVICFGVHVYRKYPHPWLGWIVVLAGVLSVVGVLSVYYYLLTSGTGSGNSQDYPTSGRLLSVLRYLIKREAINLATFIACLLGLVDFLYAGLAAGAVVSSTVLIFQLVQRQRQQRRELTARAAR